MYNGILSWGQYCNYTNIPALPFCHITLKSQKPLPSNYPQTLKTLGDHLGKRRLDLKLLQKEVAQKLGVGESSIRSRSDRVPRTFSPWVNEFSPGGRREFVKASATDFSPWVSTYNWENNLSIPALRYIPKIVEFLGYAPHDPSAKTTGEKIVAYRRFLGLSQKRLAHHLGIDPSTLGKWEKGKRQPSERVLKDLSTLLEENIRNESKMTKREAYKINRNTRKLEK